MDVQTSTLSCGRRCGLMPSEPEPTPTTWPRYAGGKQSWMSSVRGDIYQLRTPRDAVGHEQQDRRYVVVVQSDDLTLSTVIVAPTSISAHPYIFRPEVTVRGQPT